MVDILNTIKNVCSVSLLLFSIVLVMTLIFNEDTKISSDVHPALAFVLIWIALAWLYMIEGGQAPMVGLPPVNKDLYKESHPHTHRICSIGHKGDYLDRYLVGRQFMVLLVVFTANQCGAPLEDTDIFGLPSFIKKLFLGSGIAMILMTANVAQLSSQVNASHCMLDFINGYFMLFTLYVALAIEFSGMLHCVYLVQFLFAAITGKPIASQEAPRTVLQNLFFWARVAMSVALLGFAFAVTLSALLQGKTTMWAGVPEAVSVILFFVFMSIVGTLEGMQIAFFAVTKLPKAEQASHPIAMKTCDLLFRGGSKDDVGRNLPGFMVGRQICVTLCFFIIARVTTINVGKGDGNIFGVADWVQGFFNTGLLGAFITTTVGSIIWQLVASAFPVAFLSNPLCYLLLRFCLFLEATGVCNASWVIAWIAKKIWTLQKDEVYIGTPEERAKKHKEDHDSELHVDAGHPRVPAYAVGTHHLAHPKDKDTEVDIESNSDK